MTIHAAGSQLNISDINVEFGQTFSTPISMDTARQRTLAGATTPKSQYGMYSFYGKSKAAGVIVSAPGIDSYKTSTGTGTVSGSSIASPTGGTGTGYTYSWTYISGISFTLVGNTTSQLTCSRSCANGTIYTGVYRCTVTDSGANVGSTDIQVIIGGYQY